MKKIFTKEFWTDKDVNLYIGKLLRYGVIMSCAITFLGGIVYLFQQNGILPDYSPVPMDQAFSGTPFELREFPSIWQGALNFHGASIIQLGVIVLIATPVLRVAFSAFAFLVEKDYMYVRITLIVLAIIIINMIFGLH